MNYETFRKEKDRIAELSEQEQKEFYINVLEKETLASNTRLEAYFEYASLVFYEGDFRKAREILEPFAITYQSYEYTPVIIRCFNLMGVASQCEGEYVLSRYFYTVAMRIAQEKSEETYYAYEYNNICLTYISQGQYEKALEYANLAEQWLPQSDGKMNAFVALNKSDIYSHLNQLDKAEEEYEASIREYDGLDLLPDDTLICGVSLYHRTGNRKKYNDYIEKTMERLPEMYASEFIDACRVVCNCGLQDRDYSRVEKVIKRMEVYMLKHPDENRVGLQVEELRYTYARNIKDKDGMMLALEQKMKYYDRIVSRMETQRVESMDEYLVTHKQLQESIQNEIHANKTKTRFLANMSHDIRTPMNAIVGITTLMEHFMDNPRKMRSYLTKILSSSKYMVSLINDLLDMSKIESGTVSLNLESVNLSEQIEQVNEIISAQAGDKNLEYCVQTDIQHTNLMADEVRLRQVLLNILTNAVKYTPAKGRIRMDIQELDCAIEGKAQYLFRVTDTGIGMDADLLEHIFDPFKRGEDSVVNKIQGTGLGMAITKNIIDLMGGTIDLQSSPNEGSTVSIILQFKLAERECTAEEETIEENVLDGMSFLCAEDNELNAEILSALLEIAGASCEIYGDGKDVVKAFENVEEGEYDAILMDVQMPEMNGYDATRCIREGANPLGQTIPIIAMTANAFAEDIKNSLDAGMNAHISKPIDIEALNRTMRRLRRE